MDILNPEQSQAVETTEGPVIIIAGAGTGKTRVITEKISYIINQKKISPRNILALTFSNRAGSEMQDRVNEKLSTFYYDLEIGTFHSFCNRILQEYGFHIGISSDYTLLDNVGQILFLQKIYDKLNLNYYYTLSSNISTLMAFSKFFSRCKDEMVFPDDFQKYIELKEKEYESNKNNLNAVEKVSFESYLQELKEQSYVYKIYQEELLKSNCLSFNDLIIYSIQLFIKRPHILAKFQERFKYILVDEFQDTNIAQIELLRLLSAKYRNITVVGDDDQSIYHFRGASYASFTRFKEIFPELKKITLNQNYRSTCKILALANEAIKLNAESRFDPDKKLFTKNEEGKKTKLIITKDYIYEAQAIAAELKKIFNELPEDKKSWNQIAILYRAHSHKDKLLEILRNENIPFQIKGSIDLFNQSEVKDILALLMVIHNPDDNISLFHLFSFDIWNFSWEDRLYLNKIAREKEIPLFEAIDADERTKNIFSEIKQFIGKLHDKAQNILLWEIFSEIIKEIEQKTKTDNQKPKIFENKFVIDFFSLVTDYIENNPSHKLQDFITYLDIFIQLGGTIASEKYQTTDSDAVQLMTIHSAKGLEFPYVFIIGLASRRFPALERNDSIPFPDDLMKEPLPPGDYRLQEERRLFYVALTRTCKQLYLSCIEKKGTPVSQFIKEIKNMNLAHLIEEYKLDFPEINISILQGKNINALPSILLPKIDEFSYTQLQIYDDCPLRYKYNYMLRIPIPPNPIFSFGIIMHSVLQEYYLKIKEGLKPGWEEIKIIFEEKWSPKGFKSISETEKNKSIALNQLKEFFEKNQHLPQNPIMLEQKFDIYIDGAKIIGRIDRIDDITEGRRQKAEGRKQKTEDRRQKTEDRFVEVIDYKTGKPKDQKYVDKDLQLSIYAIACKEKFGFIPALLSFYYLTNNQKISTTREEKELINTKNKIGDIIHKIRSLDFTPKPSEFKCSRCDYKNFCAYY